MLGDVGCFRKNNELFGVSVEYSLELSSHTSCLATEKAEGGNVKESAWVTRFLSRKVWCEAHEVLGVCPPNQDPYLLWPGAVMAWQWQVPAVLSEFWSWPHSPQPELQIANSRLGVLHNLQVYPNNSYTNVYRMALQTVRPKWNKAF